MRNISDMSPLINSEYLYSQLFRHFFQSQELLEIAGGYFAEPIIIAKYCISLTYNITGGGGNRTLFSYYRTQTYSIVWLNCGRFDICLLSNKKGSCQLPFFIIKSHQHQHTPERDGGLLPPFICCLVQVQRKCVADLWLFNYEKQFGKQLYYCPNLLFHNAFRLFYVVC